MRIILVAALALLTGCASHAPYTPAPPIAKLDISPVARGNSAISQGNREIAKTNTDLRGSLEKAKSDLAAAIVQANSQKMRNTFLDKTLDDALVSLDAARVKAEQNDELIARQQEKIDVQAKAINDLSDENESRQKLIDAQTKEVNAGRQAIADLDALNKKLHYGFGIGFFVEGIKYLGLRLLILLVILAALATALNFLVPGLRPALHFLAKLVWKPFQLLGKTIAGLFKRKPPDS